MEISTKHCSKERREGSGQVLQLDSPLPTPRRSSGSVDTHNLHRSNSATGKLRTLQVPFSWESSPGVPKESACSDKEHEHLPPKPPPGRWAPCHVRSFYGNASDGGSSDDDDNAFSDALDKVSTSERLAAACGRLSSFDGLGSRRFEEIIHRAPSFIMDRFLPAASAIATSSVHKHPKQQSLRRAPSCNTSCKHDDTAVARHAKHSPRRAPASGSPREHHEQPTPRRSNDKIQVQLVPRINMEAQGTEMSPRACGLMVFFPWSLKLVSCGLKSPAARCRTPRTNSSLSSPKQTMGDVLENKGMQNGRLFDEKGSSSKERRGPGWGMSFLASSRWSGKRCADARRALGKLALGGKDRGSPRSSKDRRNGKGVPPLRAAAGRLPPLKPPSESWLVQARDSQWRQSWNRHIW